MIFLMLCAYLLTPRSRAKTRRRKDVGVATHCEKEFKRKKECVNCAHIISMSEIEDIADMEFDEVHVDLGELDSELDVHVVMSRTDGQDMSKELLGVVSAPVLSTSGMAHHDGRTAFGVDSCQGSSPSLFYTRHLFATRRLIY